jgi:1-acyl-sn-glycerol-3-phosphate acyltransferase
MAMAFPEYHFDVAGKLRQFKGGAFTIARKTGVKIVPVTLLGNDRVFPPNAVCTGRAISENCSISETHFSLMRS